MQGGLSSLFLDAGRPPFSTLYHHHSYSSSVSYPPATTRFLPPDCGPGCFTTFASRNILFRRSCVAFCRDLPAATPWSNLNSTSFSFARRSSSNLAICSLCVCATCASSVSFFPLASFCASAAAASAEAAAASAATTRPIISLICVFACSSSFLSRAFSLFLPATSSAAFLADDSACSTLLACSIAARCALSVCALCCASKLACRSTKFR